MIENGRKGVLTAASEKLAEIQEQIDELEALKEKEIALVQAHGDIQLAQRRQLSAHRPSTAQPQGSSKSVLTGAKHRRVMPAMPAAAPPKVVPEAPSFGQ
mmetsp:Transcript_125201/g.340038  ORF Transcript_125201/g.340038 Transcript_125201/m.340038 type:complete len:100 (+) Transcript_125201:1-300(+)